MRGVNLIPIRHLVARARRVRARRWTLGVTAYALVLVVAWGGLKLVSGGAQRAVADQLAAADERIGDTEAALRQIQPRLAAAMATLEAGNSIGDQPDWSVLMRAVAGLLGDDAVLTRFYLEPMSDQARGPRLSHRYTLHLHGLARSHENVSDFVLKLESLRLFDNVGLLTTRREPAGDRTVVGFQLECSLGGGGS